MQTPNQRHKSSHKPQFHDDIYAYCKLWHIYEPYSGLVSEDTWKELSQDIDTIMKYLQPEFQSKETQTDIQKKARKLAKIIANIIEEHSILTPSQKDKERTLCNTILKHWNTSLLSVCTEVQSNIKDAIEHTANASPWIASEDIQTFPKELAFLNASTQTLAKQYLHIWYEYQDLYLDFLEVDTHKAVLRQCQFSKDMSEWWDDTLFFRKSLCHNIYELLCFIQEVLKKENLGHPYEHESRQIQQLFTQWQENIQALKKHDAHERRIKREKTFRSTFLRLNPSSRKMIVIREKHTPEERARLQALYPHAQSVKQYL